MIPSSLLLSSLYLAYLPPTTAWFFSWTQTNGQVLSDTGNQAKPCQAIDNPKGNIFNWSADGDHVCVYLYSNTYCAGRWAGYTCEPWPWDNHAAGSDILSFVVVNNGTVPSSIASTPAATSTATTSSTSTTSTAATTISTSSPSSAPSDTGSGSHLSGGAIAGIVVGVLAAAAIAGILFFFLGWRRRRPSNSGSAPGPSETAMSELQADDDKPRQELPPSSSQSLYQQQQQQRRLGELHGSHVASEMGPGVQRAELDGSPAYGKI